MSSCCHKPNRWRYSLSMSHVHSSRAYCALPVATKAISKTLLSTNSSYFLVVTTEPIVISPLFCASGTACYLPRPPFCYLATKPFSISPASAAKMIRLEDQPVVSLVIDSNSSRRSRTYCRHIGVEAGAERELWGWGGSGRSVGGEWSRRESRRGWGGTGKERLPLAIVIFGPYRRGAVGV